MRRLVIVCVVLSFVFLAGTTGRSRAGGKPAMHAVIATRDATTSQHVLVVVGKALKRFSSYTLRIPDVADVEIPGENVAAVGGSTVVLRVPETVETLAVGTVELVARNKAGLEASFPVELLAAGPRIGVFGGAGAQGTGVYGNCDVSSGGQGSVGTGVLGTAAGSDLATVRGVRGSASGALSTGVLGEGATGVHARSPSTALRATLTAETGDIAVFELGGIGAVARIDQDGAGYFDGGVQSSGADFAETVALDRGHAEPGDVLVVDASADRGFRVCDAASSPAVAGVVSTRPALVGGVQEGVSDSTPTTRLAIVGIVPTKVCDEGGPVRRGDLLVSAQRPGYAMRAPAVPAPGTVLGKALGEVREGRRVIEVLLQAR